MLHQGNLHTLLNSYQGSLKIIKVDLHINLFLKDSRLLQPQHLGGICSGLIPYRLPFDNLTLVSRTLAPSKKGKFVLELFKNFSFETKRSPRPGEEML